MNAKLELWVLENTYKTIVARSHKIYMYQRKKNHHKNLTPPPPPQKNENQNNHPLNQGTVEFHFHIKKNWHVFVERSYRLESSVPDEE